MSFITFYVRVSELECANNITLQYIFVCVCVCVCVSVISLSDTVFNAVFMFCGKIESIWSIFYYSCDRKKEENLN